MQHIVLQWIFALAISGAWILSTIYNYRQYREIPRSNTRKRIIYLSNIALWACILLRIVLPIPFLNTRALPLIQEQVNFITTAQIIAIIAITATALIITVFIEPKK